MTIVHLILDKITNVLLWMLSEQEGRNFMLISSFTFLFLIIIMCSIALSKMDDEEDGRS